MLLNLFLLGDNFILLSNEHTVLISNFLRHHATAGSIFCYLACSHYYIDDKSDGFIRLMLKNLSDNELMLTMALVSDNLTSTLKKMSIAEAFNDTYANKCTNVDKHKTYDISTFGNYEFIPQVSSRTVSEPYNVRGDKNNHNDRDNHSDNDNDSIINSSSSTTLNNDNTNKMSESSAPLINLHSTHDLTYNSMIEMSDMVNHNGVVNRNNSDNTSNSSDYELVLE
jgi:hypothetical protein